MLPRRLGRFGIRVQHPRLAGVRSQTLSSRTVRTLRAVSDPLRSADARA
jgi:hypothetical protein